MHYYSIPRDQGAGSHVDWKVVAEKLSQLDRSFALRALPFIYAHSASSLLYLQLSYSALQLTKDGLFFFSSFIYVHTMGVNIESYNVKNFF